MPVLHLRVCEMCQHTRFAPCSTTCRAPNPADPDQLTEMPPRLFRRSGYYASYCGGDLNDGTTEEVEEATEVVKVYRAI